MCVLACACVRVCTREGVGREVNTTERMPKLAWHLATPWDLTMEYHTITGGDGRVGWGRAKKNNDKMTWRIKDLLHSEKKNV